MRNQGMMAAVALAAGLNEVAAADIAVDAAFLSTHFPDLVSGFKTEGATAERERIAAIDAAALPGHEALVAKAKAEGMTAGDFALAVVAAERSARASMAASLDTDEATLKGLRSEPANGVATKTPQDQPALTGEALWKSEFAASQKLQGEFASEEGYLAFKRAEARGGIKVMSPRTAS